MKCLGLPRCQIISEHALYRAEGIVSSDGGSSITAVQSP